MPLLATDLACAVEDAAAHGNSLHRDVRTHANAKLEELYARL